MEKGELPPPPKRWYELTIHSAHAEKGQTHKNYVYAVTPDLAFRQALSMRGWRKRLPYEIRRLSPQEEEALEEIVKELPNVRLSQARTLGVYGKRVDVEKSVSELLEEKLKEKRREK